MRHKQPAACLSLVLSLLSLRTLSRVISTVPWGRRFHIREKRECCLCADGVETPFGEFDK